MHLLKLVPEKIQIIFLESKSINNDTFYDLYQNLKSRGGEPIYIKNLKKNIILNQQFIFQIIGIPLVFIIQKSKL
jgi:hypothetical protein